MSKIERAIAAAVGRAGHGRGRPTRPAYGPRLPIEPGMDAPINDAESYGVHIEPARVTPGVWYWRVGHVHHLTPAENGGNHHIYLDVWDRDPDGGAPQRVYGARIKISLPDGDQWCTIEKPLDAPGTNFPLWKWQVAAVEAAGLPGQELPADRVTGLSTAHPDEAPGNTLFHHSFHVVYYRAQAPAGRAARSVIGGVVHGGAGCTVVLACEETETARQTVPADERFRFEGLAAGRYRVTATSAVGVAPVASDVLAVDGSNTVSVELQAPPTNRPFAHYVLFGPAGRPATHVHLLLAQAFLLAFAPAFGFSPAEAALAAQVTLIGDEAAVAAATAAELAAAGAQVQRIGGTVDEIAAALAARVAAGRAFQ